MTPTKEEAHAVYAKLRKQVQDWRTDGVHLLTQIALTSGDPEAKKEAQRIAEWADTETDQILADLAREEAEFITKHYSEAV